MIGTKKLTILKSNSSTTWMSYLSDCKVYTKTWLRISWTKTKWWEVVSYVVLTVIQSENALCSNRLKTHPESLFCIYIYIVYVHTPVQFAAITRHLHIHPNREPSQHVKVSFAKKNSNYHSGRMIYVDGNRQIYKHFLYDVWPRFTIPIPNIISFKNTTRCNVL